MKLCGGSNAGSGRSRRGLRQLQACVKMHERMPACQWTRLESFEEEREDEPSSHLLSFKQRRAGESGNHLPVIIVVVKNSLRDERKTRKSGAGRQAELQACCYDGGRCFPAGPHGVSRESIRGASPASGEGPGKQASRAALESPCAAGIDGFSFLRSVHVGH